VRRGGGGIVSATGGARGAGHTGGEGGGAAGDGGGPTIGHVAVARRAESRTHATGRALGRSFFCGVGGSIRTSGINGKKITCSVSLNII
jgi:hypothetical protein